MDKSQKIGTRKRYMSLTVVAFILVLTCFLAACGGASTASGGATGASAPTPTPTPTPVASTPTVTTVNGYGTSQGCPNDAVVTNLAPASVVSTLSGTAGSTVSAHVGDMIELRAPFGKTWGGPQESIGGLTLQNPPGFAQKTVKACVWRFDAKSVGTMQMDFTSRPICEKGAMCAMFIEDVHVTVIVK